MAASSIVIDVGSYSLKVGYAGDENGPLLIRNWMGKLKHESKHHSREEEKSDSLYDTPQAASKGIDFSKFLFGNKASGALQDLNTYSFYDRNGEFVDSLKGGLKLFYNNHVFAQLLDKMDDKDYDSLAQTNVLMTQQPFASKKWRDTLNEIMFETVNVKGVNYQYSGVLSMYATNRLDGCVLDVGYENSSIIPVIDGCPIEPAINKINLGGKHVDIYLQRLLRKSGITLHTDSEFDRIRQIKEKLCEFSLDGPFIRSNEDDEELNVIRFELPDKKILQIGSARLRAPEVLYSPHLTGVESKGLAEMLLDSINRCDVHTRRTLLSNVLMTGGTTKIGKFGQRLLQEVKSIDDNTFFDYKNVLTLRFDDELSMGLGGSVSGAGRLSRAKRRSRQVEDSSSASLYSLGDAAGTQGANSTGPIGSLEELENRIQRSQWKKTKMRLIAPEKRDISAWIGGSVLCSMSEISSGDSVFWTGRDEYLNERRKDPSFREPSGPREMNQLTDDLANDLLDDIEKDDAVSTEKTE